MEKQMILQLSKRLSIRLQLLEVAQSHSPHLTKFLSAAIHYSGSKINLDIASGATLLVSNDKAKWQGTLDVITAKNYNSITITGGGTIDGQGEVWWATPDDFRPRIVYWSGTSQGLISNVLVKNCPNHCLEMYTNQGEVANVTITNPPINWYIDSIT